MKIFVALGDIENASFGNNAVLVQSSEITEDKEKNLDIQRLQMAEEIQIYESDWQRKTDIPRPHIVRAEPYMSIIVVFRKPEENLRRFSYKGLMSANFEKFSNVLLLVRFQRTDNNRDIKTDANRIVLGIRDYVEKTEEQNIDNLFIFIDNRSNRIELGNILKEKLKDHSDIGEIQ